MGHVQFYVSNLYLEVRTWDVYIPVTRYIQDIELQLGRLEKMFCLHPEILEILAHGLKQPRSPRSVNLLFKVCHFCAVFPSEWFKIVCA